MGGFVVSPGPTTYLGKESNDLHQRVTGTTATDALCDYTPKDRDFADFVIPILRGLPSKEIAQRTGMNLRTIQRTLSAHTLPALERRLALEAFAVEVSDHRRTAGQ